MATAEYKGSFYEVDKDGFLIDSAKWNGNWARYVAETEGIDELTDNHYAAIKALRAHCMEQGINSLTMNFSKCIGLPLWRIHQLFTSRPRIIAFKMAGLPKSC